jgi:hypothetical protein
VPVSVGERANAALHRAPASKSPQGQIVQVVSPSGEICRVVFDAIRVSAAYFTARPLVACALLPMPAGTHGRGVGVSGALSG